MSEKCFCHLNGYKVKDADARARLEELQTLLTGIQEELNTIKEGGTGGGIGTQVTENGVNVATWNADRKLDKVNGDSENDLVYIVKTNGEQATFRMSQYEIGNAIVRSTPGGQIRCNLPSDDGCATNKKYVDGKTALYVNKFNFTSDNMEGFFHIIAREILDTPDKLKTYLSTRVDGYPAYGTVVEENVNGMLSDIWVDINSNEICVEVIFNDAKFSVQITPTYWKSFEV